MEESKESRKSREKAINALQDKNTEKFWCMTVDNDEYMSSYSNCSVVDAEAMLRMMIEQVPSMKSVIGEIAIGLLKEYKNKE